MIRNFIKVLSILAAGALTTGVGDPTARADELPTFVTTIKDHVFSPAEIEIPKDMKVVLLVRNDDSTAEEFESLSLNREKVISGGSVGRIFLGPLSPGRYDFFGDFNPKTAVGAIVVK